MAAGMFTVCEEKVHLSVPKRRFLTKKSRRAKVQKPLYNITTATEALNHKGSLLQETDTILIYRNGKEHVGVDVSIDLERLKSSVSGGETPDFV